MCDLSVSAWSVSVSHEHATLSRHLMMLDFMQQFQSQSIANCPGTPHEHTCMMLAGPEQVTSPVSVLMLLVAGSLPL